MTLVLYVRDDARKDAVTAHAAADLAADGGSVRVGPETLVARRAEGPFSPLSAAILADGALRDELAATFPTPSLRRGKLVRGVVLALAAAPLALLLELDRELLFPATVEGVAARVTSHVGPGRVVVDLLLIAIVGYELTRKTPRLPAIAGAALVAAGLRWALVLARLCGGPRHPHPFVYVALALALAAAVVLVVRRPSATRIAQELVGKLGISRAAFFEAVTPPPPSGALVATAIGCAAALPAVIHVARLAGASMLGQGALVLGLAVVGPFLAHRLAGEQLSFAGSFRGSVGSDATKTRILLATVTGLAFAAASVTAARLFFDSGTELARCYGRLDAETRSARAAEATELFRAATHVRQSPLLVVLTATVFPFAEERIFRGVLQDVLVRKLGLAYGIFVASLAFGVAHVGVYHVALYQTVLLGVAFGLAYAEGGIIAAALAHAIWNLIQLA